MKTQSGQSEKPISEVLNRELHAIRQACASLGARCQPKITFLVAQKRHRTRLLPVWQAEGVGRMRNVPPGTVVDQVIVHPSEESFYLASHEGIHVGKKQGLQTLKNKTVSAVKFSLCSGNNKTHPLSQAVGRIKLSA